MEANSFKSRHDYKLYKSKLCFLKLTIGWLALLVLGWARGALGEGLSALGRGALDKRLSAQGKVRRVKGCPCGVGCVARKAVHVGRGVLGERPSAPGGKNPTRQVHALLGCGLGENSLPPK